MADVIGDGPGDAVIAQLVRAEAGLLVASLSRRIGDFVIAEEAVQEAIASAVLHWRGEGVPPNPGGWLALTARNRAIDMLRHRTRERGVALRVAADLAVSAAPPQARPPDEEPEASIGSAAADERLPMLFGCCHPALSVEARLALTLRAVLGMTTANIARAFLLPEATVAQRLVRAKRKIVSAGIPFTIPEGHDLAERLDDVLTVILLTYNDGYLSAASDRSGSPADAVWLAELVARRLPDQPEAWGLLALLTLLESRAAARHDEQGMLVVLAEQAGRAGTPSRSRGPRATCNGRRGSASPAASSSRRPSPPVTPRHRHGPTPTGCRSSRCTTSSCASTVRRSSG
jgi:RNA polymerase sigma factor (sigma-70 family)